MAYNPLLPVEGSLCDAVEMRSQFQGLHDFTTQTADQTVNICTAASSANSNGVATLGMTAEASYEPNQLQGLADKVDELIESLRRP